MTVKQNIAFPLLMDRMRGWQHLPIVTSFVKRSILRTPEVADRVESTAAQLGLTALLSRRPAALSGGQRQRVALARSLVRDPSMYLLDEPLSNLDAKLRTQMRTDITALHRTVGKTFVYVTHDQVEAMTMATKIVVMDHGVIQQVGTPDEIYDQPRNLFVATFVGSPAANLIDGAVLGEHPLASNQKVPSAAAVNDVIVGVRPENLSIGPAGSVGIPAIIQNVERTGAETLIGCQIGSDPASLTFVRVQRAERYTIGASCSLRFSDGAALFFSRASGERITENISQLA
jgi:multiple sugar transport system ATP-binding protein